MGRQVSLRSEQVDGWIIAQGSDCFQGHVAGALDCPFVVLLEQDGSHETHDGVLVGEHADDVKALRRYIKNAHEP